MPAPERPGRPAGPGWREVPPLAFDGPRACRPHELGRAQELADLVFYHSRGRPPEVAARHPELFTEANRENVRVVRAGARVVALAAVLPLPVRAVGPIGPVTLPVGCLATVATHPDHRRQGLGHAVLGDAMERMRALGCDAGWLGTGIPAFYRRMGWETAGSKYEFELDESHAALLAAGALGLRCVPGGDVGTVVRLQAGEAVGAARGEALTAVRLDREGVELWTARRDGAAEGYAVFERSREESGHDRVLDHAGPAEAVATILGAWWRAHDEPGASASARGPASANRVLHVTAPDAPGGLADLLLALGLPHRRSYQGMLRAVRPGALLRSLGLATPVVEGEDAAGVTLRLGGGAGRAHRLAYGAFTRWLFGPERVPGAPEVAPGAPGGSWPLRFHLAPLDHV